MVYPKKNKKERKKKTPIVVRKLYKKVGVSVVFLQNN
jgi:hypothetical protein